MHCSGWSTLIAALSVAFGALAVASNEETLSGGDGTVFDTSRNAFSLPARNLPEERRSSFFVGNSFFNQNWIVAPASVAARDGLGPLFNARSCSGCHFKDGRGRPPADGEPMDSMLVRISVAGEEEHGGPRPHPVYGDQIQGQSIPGVPREADVFVSYEEMAGTFSDGEPFSLRRPTYRIDNPGYGPIEGPLLVSPRVSPAIIGLGLLEAIPAGALQRLADPDDADRDGVSGRTNVVWDQVTGRTAIGRFGWKAEQPSVLQQTAGAFLGDIGITSSLFQSENHTAREEAAARRRARTEPFDQAQGRPIDQAQGRPIDQAQGRPIDQAQGRPFDGAQGRPEASEKILDAVALYARSLAVPASRTADDPLAGRGRELFATARCDACHLPAARTGSFPNQPEFANQTIHAFTDLLLHDMGSGLADGRPTFAASGTEWRTPPLWGLGLVSKVNGHTFLLHDGRARNASEAILWHGGEAAASRETFRSMPGRDRAALIAFLNSL